MTIDNDDLLNSILDSLNRIEYIKVDDLPDIKLYMDQLISFMEDELHPTKRYEDDPILTKTMINNYVKNQLLPAPDKKKYSKDHILTLIFIYYFKGALSISDIQQILNPITMRYWGKEGNITLKEIYSAVFAMEGPEVEHLKESIQQEFMFSKEAVEQLNNLDEQEADFLQKFVFICLLNFDIYVRKLLVEKIIDSMKEPMPKKKKK